MKKAALGLSIIITLLPTLASAEGPYTGVSVGTSEWNVSALTSGISALTSDDISEDDSDDTGYKIFTGYRWNEYFAFEAFYTDFGEANYTNTTSAISGDVDAVSFGLSFLGVIPVNNAFDIYAKAGLHRWDADLEGLGLSFDIDDDTDLIYGVGAQYTVDKWSFRAEFERYELDNILNDIDVDVDLASIGIAFKY